MSPTHYCTGDVVYLIPLKKPIPGIPIDVVAVNYAVFAIVSLLIITCDVPVFYVKYIVLQKRGKYLSEVSVINKNQKLE